MKTSFQQLYVNFPEAAHEFSFWMMNQYKIREQDYDDAISEHRYIIAARFFGESTNLPAFVNADALEQKILDMFDIYQKAAQIISNQDPLKELANLDWQTRNKMTENSFTRKTNPSLRDTLIPLTNFRLPSLSDTLVPFEDRKPEFKQEVLSVEHSIDSDQFWIDNIKWSWDVRANKIQILF